MACTSDYGKDEKHRYLCRGIHAQSEVYPHLASVREHLLEADVRAADRAKSRQIRLYLSLHAALERLSEILGFS